MIETDLSGRFGVVSLDDALLRRTETHESIFADSSGLASLCSWETKTATEVSAHRGDEGDDE